MTEQLPDENNQAFQDALIPEKPVESDISAELAHAEEELRKYVEATEDTAYPPEDEDTMHQDNLQRLRFENKVKILRSRASGINQVPPGSDS